MFPLRRVRLRRREDHGGGQGRTSSLEVKTRSQSGFNIQERKKGVFFKEM